MDSQTFTLGHDAENRLVSVGGAITASFVYDGDGNRVKSTIAGTTTYFVGNIYELTGAVETKYYYAGSQRIAMRVGTADPHYLLSDHLGSTTVTTDASGNLLSELRYSPWGEVRSGTAPTSYTFTGQYSNVSDFGLMFYNARWYDVGLGRFAQADSIVPAGVQGWDRYAYGLNNPVKYTDPTGHFVVEEEDCTQLSCSGDPDPGGADRKDDRELLPPFNDVPYVVRLNGGIVLVFMPSGSHTALPRSSALLRLGLAGYIAGFGMDVGELAAILDILPGTEDVAAFEDVLLTYVAGVLAGENYVFERPTASLPLMLTASQDVLVTAGDAGLAGAVKLGGGVVGGPVGYTVGAAVDVVTTGASAVYDFNRTFGQLENSVSLGVAVTSTNNIKSGELLILVWP